MQNQDIQKSVLFDGSISHINTSLNDSNIVHKKSVTSITANNSKNPLNKKPHSHNGISSLE